jgi:hypothetical protein
MNIPLKYFVTLSSVLILASCTTGRIADYPAPSPTEPRAFAKFEYDSKYPISTGRILSFDGTFVCGKDLPNSQKLFQRGRGNPLISELNTEGTWIRAGKGLNLHGYAVTSASARCEIAGSFVPKAGSAYTVRLVQTGEKSCTLDVLEGETRALVTGFVKIECEKGK